MSSSRQPAGGGSERRPLSPQPAGLTDRIDPPPGPGHPPIPPQLAVMLDALPLRATIRFPRPAAGLLNLNQRTHWSTRSRSVKQWRHAAAFAALEQLGTTPAARACRPCFVAVQLPVTDSRKRDPHNYTPTIKAIVDGLVDAGAWPDDHAGWVTTIEPALYVTSCPRWAAPDVLVHLLERP